ncbi:hypothetical protein J6590_042827 [Homalodisca vitripennis]|nr:hypothetical protein J6590_042827 [Homalodisca vitripennis]
MSALSWKKQKKDKAWKKIWPSLKQEEPETDHEPISTEADVETDKTETLQNLQVCQHNLHMTNVEEWLVEGHFSEVTTNEDLSNNQTIATVQNKVEEEEIDSDEESISSLQFQITLRKIATYSDRRLTAKGIFPLLISDLLTVPTMARSRHGQT